MLFQDLWSSCMVDEYRKVASLPYTWLRVGSARFTHRFALHSTTTFSKLIGGITRTFIPYFLVRLWIAENAWPFGSDRALSCSHCGGRRSFFSRPCLIFTSPRLQGGGVTNLRLWRSNWVTFTSKWHQYDFKSQIADEQLSFYAEFIIWLHLEPYFIKWA